MLLVQLPIPPPGSALVEGNVPLAAAYLKLHAIRQGLGDACAIDILPPEMANSVGDQGLVEAIFAQRPALVGFTCYLWNIDRTLWIAARLKQRRPELKIVVGGPEITADNAWVLDKPTIDFAVFGEGEATFSELLAALAQRPTQQSGSLATIAGLWQAETRRLPPPREPLAELDAVSSPYVEGIVALGSDRRMLLETARGCRFRCKYCFYPKHYDTQRFLSRDQVLANLNYAVEHDASEVVLLDPTLNQRPDFDDFLTLLAQGNPERSFTYSGELRAEGIDSATARRLRQANFAEVEVGLQSIEPEAWKLMGRPTNLASFERGARAMIGEGIRVCVDLILGLPGDTVDSVRRAIDYLHRTQAFSQAQAFNLSILPGTAFRDDAASLRLRYQPRPPYYVLETPTMGLEEMFMLMEEVQEAFGVEFDAPPPPRPEDWRNALHVDLDQGVAAAAADADFAPLPPAEKRPQTFTLWLRSADFYARRHDVVRLVARLLADNPHTTLQVVVEPTAAAERLTAETLDMLLAACYEHPTYLDRYYSLHPGRLLGAKRVFVVLPLEQRSLLPASWRRTMARWATLLWRSNRAAEATSTVLGDLEEFEHVIATFDRPANL